MSDSLGLSKVPRLAAPDQHVEYVLIQKTLTRIFAFTGVNIDDVVNNPIARNKVIAYYKLHLLAGSTVNPKSAISSGSGIR